MSSARTRTQRLRILRLQEKQVSAILCDLDNPGIGEPLRATLLMLGKLTTENAVDASDMRAFLAAGACPQQIDDSIVVCFCSNVIGRLADSFGFSVLPAKTFEAGAKYLLALVPLS